LAEFRNILTGLTGFTGFKKIMTGVAGPYLKDIDKTLSMRVAADFSLRHAVGRPAP
jgi:hypothetical protein